MTPRTLTWLLLAATLAAGCLRLRALFVGADELALEQATYENVRSLIRGQYYRELDSDEQQKIFYGSLKGMTSSLDPHSVFWPPVLYDRHSESIKGMTVGIGLEIGATPRGLIVLTPLLDSPAWLAGVLPGDRIVRVDGQSIVGKSIDECDLLIKGPPDSPVSITLERDGVEKPIELALRRGVVQVRSIQAEELLGPKYIAAGGPKIGYVQISQFQQNTATDLDAALKRLEAQGMRALILDLRQNGGGLLEKAEQVADIFLKDGPIVTLMYRDPKRNLTRSVEPGKTHPDYPLAVLVDSQSASASEIVAGALRDRGRAVLVGDRTYGKFSVQDVIPIPLGKPGGRAARQNPEKVGALKLTIAKYKTPLSDCIDGQGLVPEFLVSSTREQQKELMESRNRRHLRMNDPRVKPASASDGDPFDDAQLRKAADVLRGKL